MYTSNAVHRGFLSKVVTEYALAGTEFFTVLQNSVVCKTDAGGKYNTSRHIMTRLSVFLLFFVYALFFFMALEGLPATSGFIEPAHSHQGRADLDSCSLWRVLCLRRALRFTLGAHRTQDEGS